MNDRDIRNSTAESLAKMMAIEAGESALWDTQDLGEILRHQLAAPLELDIIGVDQSLVAQLHSKWNTDPPIQTFGDLFGHASPPVEFLELTKQFAKKSRSDADSPLPEEVAVILHLLSIVVAMTRCGKRITKLDDQGLCYGLIWALEQSWLDEATRATLQSGMDQLGGGESTAPV
jgi:hypothetical protein